MRSVANVEDVSLPPQRRDAETLTHANCQQAQDNRKEMNIFCDRYCECAAISVVPVMPAAFTTSPKAQSAVALSP